jgi:hypothetical protein
MKITKADIQKVVREEITSSSQKDAESFPTTDRDWENFKRRFEKSSKDPTNASFKTKFRLHLLATCTAIAILAFLVTFQRNVKVAFNSSINAMGGRAPTPGVSDSTMGDFGSAKTEPASPKPATTTFLAFAQADTFRGQNSSTRGPSAANWLDEKYLNLQWNLADQAVSFSLLDGAILHGKLAPAPELNLNDEAVLRFFRIADASVTLRSGETLEVKGTLQIRASKLNATDMSPNHLSEVESALLKLKLSAKDGRFQDLWYELKK